MQRRAHLVSRDAVVILLNPDVVVAEDFFLRLAAHEWPDDLAAIGPQVRTPHGTVEQSARTFPTVITGVFGRRRCCRGSFRGAV